MNAIRFPILVAGLTALGCGVGGERGPSTTGPAGDALPLLSCTLTDETVVSGGVARGGIPTLDDPPLVPLGHPALQYLDNYEAVAAADTNSPEPRVIGVFLDSIPIAIPVNILWRHEIVHLTVAGRRVAVSFCPLTGTAIAFDLTHETFNEFGVSGLLFQNNLIMFDPETESLWPQMCLSARSGPRTGAPVSTVPVVDMRWNAWKSRFGNTLVVGSETGFPFEYDRTPYLTYEFSDLLLYPLPYPQDLRLPLKSRVLGIGTANGGIAIPFSELVNTGQRAAVRFNVDGRDLVVLWDREANAAMAFWAETTGGDPVTIQVRSGQFVDDETQTVWSLDGRALSGPRAGRRLAHHAESYMAYWFAWSSFFPRTVVWDE